jgi:hypothetical protein
MLTSYTDPVKSTLMLMIAIALRLSAFGQDITPTPSDCQKPDLLANGRPVMTPIGKDLALGISLSQQEFKVGNPIKLHIWVHNSGDAAAGVFTCSDLEGFKLAGFQIFSEDGRRILSRDELILREECRADPRAVSIWGGPVVCARNILFSIPAHTCITRDDYDFAKTLTDFYDLPPGKYVMRLLKDWRTGFNLCSHENPEQFHKRPGDLTFIVTKP